MMPFALALAQHGHEVAFATGEHVGTVIRECGLRHFVCGIPEASTEDALLELPEWPMLSAQLSGAPLGIIQLHAFIEGIAPLMWPTLEEVMTAWKPDLIVRDPLEFSGVLAAEKAHIPYATVDWATHIPAQQLAGSAFSSLASRLGLNHLAEAMPALDRHLVLSAMPPAWQYAQIPNPEGLVRYAVPPFDQSGSSKTPSWVAELPEQPLIYATLGTTFNRSPKTFKAIIEALANEPVTGIVTVGFNQDPAEFGPMPKNVRIERYIPQSLLLPHCSAMIFHGGFNSLHAALWHGVPMVFLPLDGGDQGFNAAQAVAHGLGLIPEAPTDANSLRRNLQTVLSDGRYKARAAELQSAMRALPSLSQAVTHLETLARTATPHTDLKEARRVELPLPSA
jgi:UDP:flavonoid glycosyltransferase YjiC (YdhE family)